MTLWSVLFPSLARSRRSPGGQRLTNGARKPKLQGSRSRPGLETLDDRLTPNQLLGIFGMSLGGLADAFDASELDTLVDSPPPESAYLLVGTSSFSAADEPALTDLAWVPARTSSPAASSQPTWLSTSGPTAPDEDLQVLQRVADDVFGGGATGAVEHGPAPSPDLAQNGPAPGAVLGAADPGATHTPAPALTLAAPPAGATPGPVTGAGVPAPGLILPEGGNVAGPATPSAPAADGPQAQPAFRVGSAHGAGTTASPLTGTGPAGGFTPDQIRTGYGFYKAGVGTTNTAYNSTAGSGQTIAIIDAYDDPNIAADLATFDQQFSLPGTDTGTGTTSVYSFFSKVDQTGGTSYPAADSGWAGEIALDVEWAHAMAPAAKIVLVESQTSNFSDMLTAVDYGSGHANVVSMSWGAGEFSSETSSSYDGHFSGHSGVVFVASSGDYGAPASWPAVSPNVVAVGGTSLKLTSTNGWSSETAWGNGSLTWYFGGSGGGISSYESQPSYQKGYVSQSSTKRTSPDVAYDADPNTGVSVYDSYGSGGWAEYGGTSAGAPQWSALTAIADQGRTSTQGALSTSTVLTSLYKNQTSTYFHDITSGSAGKYSAKTGYDLVTGIGSPKVDQVVSLLKSA